MPLIVKKFKLEAEDIEKLSKDQPLSSKRLKELADKAE